VSALAQACISAQDGDSGNPCGESCESAATAKIGRSNFVFVTEEAELESAMRTTVDAVHAHQAFGLAPRNSADWVVTALAVEQAAIAFVAS
jgi:hypothetical protein